jgi:hypothetical protein
MREILCALAQDVGRNQACDQTDEGAAAPTADVRRQLRRFYVRQIAWPRYDTIVNELAQALDVNGSMIGIDVGARFGFLTVRHARALLSGGATAYRVGRKRSARPLGIRAPL